MDACIQVLEDMGLETLAVGECSSVVSRSAAFVIRWQQSAACGKELQSGGHPPECKECNVGQQSVS